MLINLLISIVVLFLAGAGLIICTHKIRAYPAEAIRKDWLKYIIYSAIIIGFITVAFAGKIYLACIFMVIALAGALELTKNWRPKACLSAAGFIVFLMAILAGLFHLLILPGKNWAYNFAYIFLLVSITDSYSQLWGKLIGKRKLCPDISPNKTWAGFWGGLFTAVIGAVVLSRYIINYTALAAATYGLSIALASNIGDLAFSLIKRRLKIKDFSNMIPGHGGILDRFDSLIVAAPVSYWLHNWLLK